MGSTSPDAIAGLLATIYHSKIARAVIWGNLPQDKQARDILNDSGFRNYVAERDQYVHPPPKGKIQKRKRAREVSQVRFDQFLANELIEFGTGKLYGTPRPNGPSFSVFCEAMLNTLNHASKNTDVPEPWWASVYYDAERQRACFTFIDQGVGIFQSYSIIRRLQVWAELNILNRGQVLERLFQGKIPSSTEQPGRGNGIPEMYVHCKAQRIRNLAILTNNVIGTAETEQYRVLDTTFEGTLLYWEITT